MKKFAPTKARERMAPDQIAALADLENMWERDVFSLSDHAANREKVRAVASVYGLDHAGVMEVVRELTGGNQMRREPS